MTTKKRGVIRDWSTIRIQGETYLLGSISVDGVYDDEYTMTGPVHLLDREAKVATTYYLYLKLLNEQGEGDMLPHELAA